MENQMFKKLENNRPFLKMAFEGFAGDGKTYTATQVAIGIHKLIKSKNPIALFDTEKAFKALKPEFDKNKIEAVVNDEHRSLSALSQAIKWCEEGNADILIIDSITHVWEEYIKAYMNRPDKNGKEVKRSRLEFQDWGVIKPKWKEEFSTPFVLAKCHIIFTGRAGYEYTDEKNAETGKREIFKSGIKMKAENETAFEPDILVLMQKKQDLISDHPTITRDALIVKDRTTQIDGKSFTNPTFEDFYPAVKVLLDGTLREVHGVNIPDTFGEFENKYSEIGQEKTRIIAEIEGCFELMGLGTGAQDKQVKAWTLAQVYGVNSTEMVERKTLALMREGLKVIQGFAAQYKEYMNECLDKEVQVEKTKIQEMMKNLIAQPVLE
jgi:hypothetical protein